MRPIERKREREVEGGRRGASTRERIAAAIDATDGDALLFTDEDLPSAGAARRRRRRATSTRASASSTRWA